MNGRALFAGITSAFIIFTYFSLPTLRSLYGEQALLAVYAGMAVLTGITVYIVVERTGSLAKKIYLKNTEDENDNCEENKNDKEEEKENEDNIVEQEMNSLKED
jgi:hypothetical protein